MLSGQNINVTVIGKNGKLTKYVYNNVIIMMLIILRLKCLLNRDYVYVQPSSVWRIIIYCIMFIQLLNFSNLYLKVYSYLPSIGALFKCVFQGVQ